MNVDQSTPDENPTAKPTWITRLGKDAIFWMSMFYAALMFTAGVLHRTEVINLFENDNFLVPLSIPWFGAIGAIMISLQAVFERRDDWDPAYNYWHLARPLIGATLGIMSYLILSVIVTLAGSTPPDTSVAPNIGNMNIFHVLAFIVGYREETFRDLLKRVTDLILRPTK